MNNASLSCQVRRLQQLQQSCRFVSRRRPNSGKPPILPPAKTKRYRVVHVPWQDAEEVKELTWRRHAYYDALKSLRLYFQEQLSIGSKASGSTKDYDFQQEEEFRKILAENDEVNRQQADARKARQEAELNQVNEQLSRLVQDHVTMALEARQRCEAEVLTMIEKSKDFVTPENLEKKIHEALENPVDFNFAVDLTGNVYTGNKFKKYNEDSVRVFIPVSMETCPLILTGKYEPVVSDAAAVNES